ncbi:hypothetical protein [Capnocytophaga felis]|uniref:Uncharacterized protein n=1 Tax=Capnocytophaga felis TaxID=2267611 RepID=A0A5M4B8G2_9FLAO|nr:hypothetical protein [Capnocytophaga felis]GET45680.1 hypothetical protein RCZ01_09820 [Capnocytophaga felis]GET47904.1 hypothetical protein RCZ02_07350 [Capnocytophaga felis]
MKKIFTFILLTTLFSCGKQVEEVIIEKKIEKIVKVDPKIKSESTVAYYFEEQNPILTNKKQNENFITIDWYEDELFLGVEATNGTNKTYSVQKLDLQTGVLTELISNLKEIKDVAINNDYLFITQSNTVQVFDRKTFSLQTTIGTGRDGYDNNGMFQALTLLPMENHLLIRDLRRLLFYRNSDIIPENSKKISAPIRSAFSQRSNASLAYIDKKLYLSNNNSIETYDLQENMLINNEQSASKSINFGTRIYQLAQFRGHLYASFGELGFARIDTEKGIVGKRYTNFQSTPLSVTCFTFSEDKLFVINNINSSISLYNVKNIIYKEY